MLEVVTVGCRVEPLDRDAEVEVLDDEEVDGAGECVRSMTAWVSFRLRLFLLL